MGLVDSAEKEIKEYQKKVGYRVITNVQLRKIYSMTLETCKNNLSIDGFEYLRMKILYQCAKEPTVKVFYNEMKIDEKLKECCKSEVNLKEKSTELKKYMESLVAFHKYYIGK